MKINVVFVVGYNGVGFYGVQYVKGLKTVEGVIMDALFELKCIKESNYMCPVKLRLKSVSRTDKGVHAMYNLFQVKVEVDIINDSELYKSIKEHLIKNNIILYKILRVTKSFLGYRSVTSRTYNYYIPTYFLDPNVSTLKTVTKEEIIKYLKGFRIDKKIIEEFNNKALSNYIKLKSYHNFSTSKIENDPMRYVKKMSIDEELIVYDDVEYAKIEVCGNSFIMHQIRKMIGFAIISFTQSSPDIMERNFTDVFLPNKSFYICRVPGEYLLLADIDFYVDKFKDGSKASASPDVNPSEIKEFTKSTILPEIFNPNNLDAWVDFYNHIEELKDKRYKYYFE